jgi:predicted RNA polymerase sigma factor
MVNGALQANGVLVEVFREEAGHITSSLMRRFGDFDLAEESTQDALVAALETWPENGVPERPGAWLLTVASRRALNQLDRGRRLRQKVAELAAEPAPEQQDDRLRLIFTCCHPALARDAQVGLTLRAVCGFTTAEVARAFLVSETAVAQRLVRAKRRIVAAGIPYRVPSGDELDERLSEVLTVLYLLFNEAHLSTRAGSPYQRDLAGDAAWLAALLCRFVPREPEALGLLALMRLHLARGESRFDAAGRIVLLADQDRTRWDADLVADAIDLLTRAARLRRPGPYQLEAAIAACHAEAPSFAATDWPQIVALYDLLFAVAPSPVVRLNRAIALWKVEGPEPALRELGEIATDLDGYHIFHATHGQLLHDLGQREQARAAELRALDLTNNRAERALLERRLFT